MKIQKLIQLGDSILISKKRPKCPKVHARVHLKPAIGKSKTVPKINKNNFEEGNFVQVNSKFFRGGLPNTEALKELAAEGIKTIICLRNNSNKLTAGLSIEEERKIVQSLGMKFLNIHLNEGFKLTKADIKSTFDAILNKPVFVHCTGGADRTGLIGALYRVEHDNWSFKKTYKEMLDYVHDFLFFNNIDTFLEKYCIAKGENPVDVKRTAKLIQKKHLNTLVNKYPQYYKKNAQ